MSHNDPWITENDVIFQIYLKYYMVFSFPRLSMEIDIAQCEMYTL